MVGAGGAFRFGGGQLASPNAFCGRCGAEMKVWIASVALLLTGCVPAHVELQGRVFGKVLDAKTREPISGAQLFCKENPGRIVQSTTGGQFELSPVREWHVVRLGGDWLSPPCTLEAEAPKHRVQELRVWYGDDTAQIVLLESDN